MSNLTTELARLEHQIVQADAATRHHYQPQLRRMMERLRAESELIPARTKQLHEELLCQAIEAQFDNMPV